MPPFLPDTSQILDFIKRHGEKVSKHDIAHAFGLRGSDRIALETTLKEPSGNKGSSSRILPRVAVLDIYARDDDGEFLARLVNRTDQLSPCSFSILIRHDHRMAKTKGSSHIKIGSRVLARLELQDIVTSEDSQLYYAYVIKQLERKKRADEILGVFRFTPDGRPCIECVDRKLPHFFLLHSTESDAARPGDLVSVTLESGHRNKLAMVRIVGNHGKIEGPHTFSKIAIQAHNIPDTFSEEALQEAASASQNLTLPKWEDLRHIPFITIDPEDARDHDDAVWAKRDTDPLNPDGIIIMVAIADVAHYIRSGSAMDQEAQLRGNSIYFPGQVVPMLPEPISNHLCSLKEKEERPVLVVRMVFDSQGYKKYHLFTRAIIRPVASLSYQYAQAIMDGQTPHDTPLLASLMEQLSAAHRILMRGRNSRSPLELNLPERKVLLDREGHVAEIAIPPRLETHRLIEEFMIQANISAAETLEKLHTPLLYRIHEPPSQLKMSALQKFLSSLKLKRVKKAPLNAGNFNTLLSQVKNTSYETSIQEIILRTQSQAEYAVTNCGHFGLNLLRYAHFTSPIRRYSDLLVHRALIHALRLGDDGLTYLEKDELHDIATSISATERRAMAAERETLDRLVTHFLRDRVGASFDATVSGVTRSGLFVRLVETGADGFIPRERLSYDRFCYNEEKQALTGLSSGMIYRIGDKLSVKLTEAFPLSGSLRFDLSDISEPSANQRKSRKGNNKKRKKS